MEPIYTDTFTVNDAAVDRYGRLRPSMILSCIQQAAGRHCSLLALDYETLEKRRLFFAVTRHHVSISRLPHRGETIRIETWPMPTTKVAFPRSVIAYDEQGGEVFRAISIWVLMDLDTRAMVLPGKSGIDLAGALRGTELACPRALAMKVLPNSSRRTVCFTDLDRNGHMNNTRYFDWIDDLLPSDFHLSHPVSEFTICYHTEAREGQTLTLGWEVAGGDGIHVDGTAENAGGGTSRVFSAAVRF